MTDHDDASATPPEARQALRTAMEMHARGEIDAALSCARDVVERWPDCAQALSYLGQTLLIRKRRFAEGLALLDRAVEVCGDDPYLLYSAAWCREFVANAIERPKGAHQRVAEHPTALYARAREELLRALALEPDGQLRGDVEDILDVIAKATGEPWDEGWYARAAPRSR